MRHPALFSWLSALALLASGVVRAQSYEAPLPPQISTDPDLCAYAPCRDVIDADSFSHRKGRPTYVEAYRDESEDKEHRGENAKKHEDSKKDDHSKEHDQPHHGDALDGLPGAQCTSDVMSPKSFRSLIKPHLIRIIAEMPKPVVLHICGDTNAIVGVMAECGADAISVDQKNNLVETRQKIGPNVVLLGNFDPVKVLHKGEPANAGPAVLECLKNGADAVWPGCDLWPEVPAEKMTAMMKALSK